MIRLALLILGTLLLGWLVASLAFASLSLWQTILGWPGRVVDWLIECKERRERQRIARAREADKQERLKEILEWINSSGK